MSESTDRGVKIEVSAWYSPEYSDPPRGVWFFPYTVRITNVGDDTVQLLTRHWVITDARGGVEEVRGAGVVGKQPVLQPGQSFEYTSGCPLQTPFGSMHGSYQMVDAHGEGFDVSIPAFSLSQPDAVQ